MVSKLKEPFTVTKLKLYASVVSLIFAAGVAYAYDQARDIADSEKIEANGGQIEKLEIKVDANEVKRQGDHDIIVETRTDVKWIVERLKDKEP